MDTDALARTWSTTTAAEFMSSEAWTRPPHVALLGYRVAEAEHGRVVLRWTVPEQLLNPAGIAHGGFLVAMLDDAAGLAAATAFPRFVPQLTVQMSTDFLAPVQAGVEHEVVGELVRSGRSTSVADARIVSPDGATLTRATGVFQPNRRAVPRDAWELAGLA